MVLRRDINRIDLLKEIGLEFPNGKGAEIGTFKGEFAKEILQNWSGTLYMIDVWRPLGEEYLDSSNHAVHSTAYSETMNNISGYEDRGIMIRATSEVAADMFERESLDFVYIDANHAYDFVVEDIKLWYPKVKSGGYLCGHDYINLKVSVPNLTCSALNNNVWKPGDFIVHCVGYRIEERIQLLSDLNYFSGLQK